MRAGERFEESAGPQELDQAERAYLARLTAIPSDAQILFCGRKEAGSGVRR